MALVAIALASAGLLACGVTPALAKAKPKPMVYTFYVDSRGGVLWYHSSPHATHEMDGVHVRVIRATVPQIERMGYRPDPVDKPHGYLRPPKGAKFYASKYSLYYSQNRHASFIVAHRGGRLRLTWKQVIARKLIADPKTKPCGWVGFKSYYQAEPQSFLDDALSYINAQRAAIGNPPVSFSTTRCVAAQSWTDYLCRVHGVTGHDTPHTSGMTWDTWQSEGAGWEGVGFTHEPVVNLMNGAAEAAQECVHVPAFVTESDIAYIGIGVTCERTSIGWDGCSANCFQADGDTFRGGSIDVTSAPLSVSAGTTATVTATITPDTPGDTFTWSVVDSSIATLTATGGVAMLTPLSPGTTTIHVRTGVSQVDATATFTVVN